MRVRAGLILGACVLALAACSDPAATTKAEQAPAPAAAIVTEKDLEDTLLSRGLLREREVVTAAAPTTAPSSTPTRPTAGPTAWFVAPGQQNCWIHASTVNGTIVIDRLFKPIDNKPRANGVSFTLNPSLNDPNLTMLRQYVEQHPLAFSNCAGEGYRRPDAPTN